MSTEIELLRRQNAALLAEVRFWSGEHKHAGDCEFGEEGCYLCRNAEKERFLKITKPLLANADAELLTKEQVRPLVEALEGVLEWTDDCHCLTDEESGQAGGITCPVCYAKDGLTHARSLGF